MGAAHDLALRDSLIESGQRELELLRYEAMCKYNDFERCIARLNSQMDANLIEFEESKKTVKLIYEKMMGEKLSEQAEAYETMLRIK